MDRAERDHLEASDGHHAPSVAPAGKLAMGEPWWSSWAKKNQAKNRMEEEPFPGAVARIFIRREASSEALARIKRHLVEKACGQYAFASFGEWTALDLERPEDALLVRRDLKAYVDGWKESGMSSCGILAGAAAA
ncbi:hypothetical protein JNW90_07440 [Micromonospora sp. STR1s_5]|nr:hypothetical protein [Micromonospora sp. STR1s_5]